MRVAVYARPGNTIHIRHLHEVISLLIEAGLNCLLHSSVKDMLDLAPDQKCDWFNTPEELVGTDAIISMGGDGTLLDTLNYVRENETPVLGINTGRLGFLANVSPDRIHDAVQALLNGKLKEERRALIKAGSPDFDLGDFPYALNEATIHKKDTSSMISIGVEVDGTFMNTYWADGIIVCTPTGSTAYSLSCGGPIVMPGSENLTITPIAPHNLNVRPFVLSNNHRVSLKAEGREEQFLFTLDSRSYTIPGNTRIVLERAPFGMKLLRFEDQDFFSTIRNKMMWGLDKRN